MSITIARQFTRVGKFNQTLQMLYSRSLLDCARQSGKAHLMQQHHALMLRELTVIASEIDPPFYKYLWVNPYELHKQLDQAGIPAPRLRGTFLPLESQA